MIEIEKNFDLKQGDKERLIKNARFLSRKKFTDVYYDTANFSLTGKDYWFRQREKRWELKVPMFAGGIDNRKTDQYKELETEEEIAKELEFGAVAEDFTATARSLGFLPFAEIVTTRETYEIGEFHLDFDEMDFGFTTFEAEIMVKEEKEIAEAEDKIIAFAKKFGISKSAGHGKVIEYIIRNNLKHYEFLKKQGIIYQKS